MKKYLILLALILWSVASSYAGGSKKFMKLYKKGKALYGKINYSGAITYFEQAETEAKKVGIKDTIYGNLLTEMANSYLYLKDKTKAETYYFAALAAIEQSRGKDNIAYLQTTTGLSKLFFQKSQFDNALQGYLSALPLFEKLNQKNTVGYSEAITAIGTIYIQKGAFVQAESYFTEAEALIRARTGTETIEYTSTLNNLSLIYSVLTDYDKAEKTFTILLQTKEKISGKQSSNYATSLSNRGTMYFNLNRYKAAEADLTEALAIYSKDPGKESPNYATALNNLGVLYKASQQFDKSKQAFSEALSIREKNPGKESAVYATSLHNLGSLYNEIGDYGLALPYLTEASAIREKLFGRNHPDFISSLDELGLNKLFQEKYPEAKPYFTEAVSSNLAFIQQNFPGMNEKEKTGFISNYGKYFEHFYLYGAYLSGYRGTSNKAEASFKDNQEFNGNWYTTRIATKGIILSAVQKTRTRILASEDATLIEKYTNWEKLKNQLAQNSGLSIAERTQKNIDLLKLKEEADKIEKELSLQSEAFKKVYDPQPITWKTVQSKLKKGEAAVEMIRIATSNDTLYTALIITPESIAPEALLIPQGKALEKKYFKYYQNCIRFKILDEVSYGIYWNELDTKLKTLGKFSKVYLSTDGIYNQLNPATFYNTKSKKYLGEEIELYLVSSTKELTEFTNNPLLKKKALLIGNPDFRLDNSSEQKTVEIETTRAYKGTMFTDLPGTAKEIKNINATLTAFGWKTQVFSRGEASEDKIKQIGYPSLVHIATHGFFIGSNNRDLTVPMLSSGIALAGVNARPEYRKTEDGVLTAYEAMNLQLDSTSLVVLSACETGLGETKTGEGVYGIQRGLRVSGAKTIIMSLWKVDDAATQELMSTFYKEWIVTNNKRLAFRKAQAAIKKKYIYPYYWGAFVMIGE